MPTTRSWISRATWTTLTAAGLVTAGLTGYLSAAAGATHTGSPAPAESTTQAASTTSTDSGDRGPSGFHQSAPVTSAGTNTGAPAASTRGS